MSGANLLNTDAVKEALRLIDSGEASCAVIRNGKIVRTEKSSGIAPVVKLVREGALCDSVVVDKIVGRAAAMLLTLGKACACFGVTMSRGAQEFFEKSGIAFAFSHSAEKIVNRSGDGPCPMEEATEGISDPEEALVAVEKRIAELRQDASFFKIMSEDAEAVNRALAVIFEGSECGELSGLLDAEKYSLLAGGKRIRPILVLAFARLFGGTSEAAMPFALAVEMIHTASLIHDDLPAIDNDDLRRGKPTNHAVFGEAVALLAADALFIDSFATLAGNESVSPKTRAEAVLVLAKAAGTRGLVGGEYTDVLGEGGGLDLPALERMHKMKTGALIRAAAVLGALSAGVSLSDERIKDAELYADNVGLAFQVIDDVLDVVAPAEELGKNPGSDARAGKTTFLTFSTVDEALEYASRLTEEAVGSVSKYPCSEFLVSLARHLSKRKK